MRRLVVLWIFSVFCGEEAQAQVHECYTPQESAMVGRGAGPEDPGIRQGMVDEEPTDWCRNNRNRVVAGRFPLPRRAYRATLHFSQEDCDLFPETEVPQEEPEGKFAMRTSPGLHIYRMVLHMVTPDGRSYTRSFCAPNNDDHADLPFGAVDWSDSGGLYRVVPNLQPGDRLEEGEQTTFLIPDDDLPPDCYMVICIRGRGVPCRIPFPQARWHTP